jgi:hypothetical protein
LQPFQWKPSLGYLGTPNGFLPPQVSLARVLALAPRLDPACNVIAIFSVSVDKRTAAIAGAELLASTPGLQFTVLAPADVAQPTGEPTTDGATRTATNGSGALLQRAPETSTLVETTREIERRGLTTRMRTTEGNLEDRATEIAAAHDLVVLPASMADEADRFPVPTLVAP